MKGGANVLIEMSVTCAWKWTTGVAEATGNGPEGDIRLYSERSNKQMKRVCAWFCGFKSGPLSRPILATLHTQFVPRGAQGVGPEIKQNPCQNGVSRKLPPGLPDQQRCLGTLSGAHSGGSGGLGRGSRKLQPGPRFWQGKWRVKTPDQPLHHLGSRHFCWGE
eukprot:1149975-Pelagomonas_calceolata.AAC.7